MMIWRYTKAQVHWSWVLPPLWLGAMFGWVFFQHRVPDGRHVRDLLGIFEYFLPLALALFLAGVPALEREEGAAETHLGYRQFPTVRFGLLALPRLMLWAVTVAVGLLVVQLWYLPEQSRMLLQVAAPPALALGGAALAGAAVARHQMGGVIAAFLWWAMDATGQGRFNQQYFLFRASFRTPLFTPDQIGRNIALVGAACLLLALWLSHRRSWWIK